MNPSKNIHYLVLDEINRYVQNYNKSPNELWMGMLEYDLLVDYLGSGREFNHYEDKIQFCGLKLRTNPNDHSRLECMWNPHY